MFDTFDTKGFLASRTVWMGIVGVAASAVGLIHYSISAADQTSLVDAILQTVTGVSSIGAIVYRVLASKKIG